MAVAGFGCAVPQVGELDHDVSALNSVAAGRKNRARGYHMKLVLTSVTFLTIIATPALAQTYDPNAGPAKKISNLGQYGSSGHRRPRYKHGYYYERTSRLRLRRLLSALWRLLRWLLRRLLRQRQLLRQPIQSLWTGPERTRGLQAVPRILEQRIETIARVMPRPGQSEE